MKSFLMAMVVLSSLTAQSVSAVSPQSAISLGEGSEFLVHLSDSELLEKGEKTWQILDEGWRRKCELSIASHYDAELAKNAGDVVYHFHQFHSGNDLSYYNGTVRDQFNVWLTTDNKDLPMLGFDCFQEVPLLSSAPKKFTFGSVTELIGQPQFFLSPVAVYDYKITPFDLLPKAEYMVIGESLRFKAVKESDGSLGQFEVPHIGNGRQVGKGEKAACWADYSPLRLESYDVTLIAGDKWPIKYFQQYYGNGYMFTADKNGARLTVDCRFDQPIEDISEIRKQLGHVIEIQ